MNVQRFLNVPSYIVIALLTWAVVSSLFVVETVSAQSFVISGKPAHPDPSNERSKSIFIKKLIKGQVISDEIEIVNGSSQSQRVLVYATDSTSSNDGAFACAQASDTVAKAGSWIKLASKEVTVDANKSIKVPFTITAPYEADPGEHDACIILQQVKDPTVQPGISLNFRTGIRVAMLVPGQIIKQIKPIDIKVGQTNSSVIVTPIVRNSGTVSVDASIHTYIRPLLGTHKTIVDSKYPVLRGQDAEWNIELAKPFWGGLYSASYSLRYDASANFIGESTTKEDIREIGGPEEVVYIFPALPALIIEISLLIFLGFGIYFVVKWFDTKLQVKKHWVGYTVKTEQLTDIAERHSVSWKLLAKTNNIKAPYHLKNGQKIKVPPKLHEVKKKSKK